LPAVRLAKRHAEALANNLDQPVELFGAVVDALRQLLEISALTVNTEQVIRSAATRANWPDRFVEQLCIADEGAVEQVALSLIELRTL
jgi:hypothetical protein